MRVSRHRHKRLMSEINVVPYIDVMLVLLVIFMVTAPLMMEGVTIDLPAADAKPVGDDRSEPFVVRVDREGTYYLNEDKQPYKISKCLFTHITIWKMHVEVINMIKNCFIIF